MGAPLGSLWTLPNLLTLSRLVLAVVLFVCISFGAWLVGLIVFGLAALTDWLDGYLARVLNLGSALGRSLDPLVDKVLVCGAYIFLLPLETRLTPWMVTLIVGRELLITGLRGYLETAGVAFGADRWGKLKMVLQCASIIGLLLERIVGNWAEMLTPANTGLLYVMLAITAWSGLQYVSKAIASQTTT
jgi:CDP-diacylglycerol--glycerol-3-phosphate 3-phosphatidyltransferase